jgi:hypothetical protein
MLCFKLESLSTWLLSEPISGVPNSNYHPHLELRFSESADGFSSWKVTGIKKVVGCRMPITDAMDTGSEEVGHGLLLKWAPGGEAIIHRTADLDTKLKLHITCVASGILACRILAQKPDHSSVWLYVLITILINTYYITFYITHSYR